MPKGSWIALLSAALFGVSPSLVKLVVNNANNSFQISSIFLAGLLYLGSGIGLQVILLLQKKSTLNELKSLTQLSRLKLLGAIFFGGILAPILLTSGIQLASAFEVSLLLNLETVTTTFIAFLIFREHVSKHVWIGKILIVIGACLIGLNGNFQMSLPAFLIVGACICWGLDNNLTREIENLPATVLASVKGWTAGGFNVLLAFSLNQTQATLPQVGASLFIGMISYGVSLILFIEALRLIGTSRTSTYFAVAPLIGMLFALVFLGDNPPTIHWIAAIFMSTGIWTLYREQHAHTHTHENLTHRHKHVHDEHHQHQHNGTKGPDPHDHVHTHEPLTHSHPHLPDTHHRHQH